MRNISFFNSIKFWGGGEKLHLENAIEFEKLDYQVFLQCKPNSPLWIKAKNENLNLSPIKVSNLSFLNPFKIIKLVRFYKRVEIDTVVFSASQDLKLGSFAAHLAGVKRIVYLRGLAAPVKNSILNCIIFSRFLTHIIPNSNETKDKMLQHLGQLVDANKVKTIYHGIDPEVLNNDDFEKFEPIKELGHGIILGNAGRLTKQKGQDQLIEIAKKLKAQAVDFTLFIAGGGDLQAELEAMIQKYDLQQNVVLLGFVEDMERFMKSIDIFVLSSIWEGFGFVLVEAMIQEKPIVAFDITSNPEIVSNNETGFLIDYPNLEAFTEKLIELCMNEQLRTSMGSKGKESVYRRFILKDRVREIEAFLLNN